MADTIYHIPTTGEEFVRLAKEGHFAKNVLADTLDAKSRRLYLKACAALERAYTEACDAANDPCLESGCSMDHEHGEICLQPLQRAEVEYRKACAAEWIKLFRSPENRIAGWRTA
jgi:hypothetical protein